MGGRLAKACAVATERNMPQSAHATERTCSEPTETHPSPVASSTLRAVSCTLVQLTVTMPLLEGGGHNK
jgi:hypothetical protein